MTTGVLRCLLCDRITGTFRRMKPHKLYVCTGCLKKDATIADALPQHVDAFRLRHAGQVI